MYIGSFKCMASILISALCLIVPALGQTEELVLSMKQGGGTPTFDIGEAAFNAKFWGSSSHILKRVCMECAASHQLIYYKRLTDKTTFNLYYNVFDTWSSNNNVLGIDFNLYSSWDDVVNDVNAWTYCNYDDPGVGAFRDCGPSGWVGGQWISAYPHHAQHVQNTASFYIIDPPTYTHMGCYADTQTRALPYSPAGEATYGFDANSCSIECSDYRYFAVQNGNSGLIGGQCFCGSDWQSATQYGTSTKCANLVGGDWANDIFMHDSVCINNNNNNAFSQNEQMDENTSLRVSGDASDASDTRDIWYLYGIIALSVLMIMVLIIVVIIQQYKMRKLRKLQFQIASQNEEEPETETMDDERTAITA